MSMFPRLPEPYRHSVYEYVNENLKNVDRRTYVHRTMITGEYTPGWDIAEDIRNLVETLNDDYCEERLTGMLLYYQHLYTLILEGAEETSLKYINLLMRKFNYYIGKMKFLATFHHCYKRLFENFICVTGEPPRLLQKMNPESTLKETFEHIKTCVVKLFKLSQLLIENPKLNEIEDLSPSKTVSVVLFDFAKESMGSLTRPSHVLFSNESESEKRRFKLTLPEVGLLNFILESSHIKDIRETLLPKVSVIRPIDIAEEQTHPCPQDLCPSGDMFTKPLDAATDLPQSYLGPVNKKEKYYFV